MADDLGRKPEPFIRRACSGHDRRSCPTPPSRLTNLTVPSNGSGSVCKRDGELLERPHALPGTDEHGLALWQKLMVYTSESARHGHQPIHRALIRALRQRKSSRGATVLRGIWGFHGDHEPHGDKLFQLSRHVPVVTIVIDTPQNIADSFDVIDEFTKEQGLVTSEMVSALLSVDPALLSVDGEDRHGGTRMANHPY